MENMKTLTKVTAGILSFALAMGAVSTVPAAPRLSSAVAAETSEEQLYDYCLQDVFILSADISEDKATFKAVPRMHGIYSIWSYSHIMSFEIDPALINESSELFDKDVSMIDNLSDDSVVTIKFTSKYDYPLLRLTEEERENMVFDSRETYKIYDIVKIEAPGIHYYGDINDDGVIDSFDLITYRKCLADPAKQKELNEFMFGNGDINKNDEIDDDDLKRVSDYILGNIDDFYGDCAIGSVRLDNTVSVEASEGKVTDEAFAKAEMNFGIDLLKRCFDPTKKDEENLLISPLSISSALAMTANGADGKTKEEMEKVLCEDMTLDQLNEYLAYYAANLPDESKKKIYLANSIWFKDDPTLQVYDSFLETNKKFYNSEIYKTPFNENTVNDINSWVSKNTRGMIPSLLQKNAFEPKNNINIMMVLMNTLYFEAEWRCPYTSSYDGKFTDLNGIEHNIKRMSSEESKYYDLGDADAFKKDYEGGDYSFVGILPKEKNIIDYINDLDADKLAEGLKEYEDPDSIELHVMIPKFKYNYKKSLSEVLENMGMADAFDNEKADFSKINDLSVTDASPLFINDVLHKTRIEVTEKGTKAAAVTAIMMAATSALPPERKKIYIELDRPFVYMIVDKNNVPLFIGAATQLEEK
ncbi:serpin family protein [Ruminococcus flavefaciens]|uniref:Dockerin domain-containing protein n=1 Tax=Ruminococcus flavefaciens 007c TaxID=1341157 RepID=W7UIP9_RUMFL|nr:serpin family protein [Ruminococcus flavefaciens]EWM55106.1 hypothetical protein RF007C_05385 [Ruminococcus flavefaciens 007c]